MTLVTFLLWSNFVLSMGAAAANVWAALNHKIPQRLLYWAVAVMAFIYSMSFLWLYYNPTLVGEWSQTLRPFSLFAWVLVWSLPPIVATRNITVNAQKINAAVQAVNEENEALLDQRAR